jgi:hypothetical protein
MLKRKNNEEFIKNSIKNYCFGLNSHAMNKNYFMYMYLLNKVHHVYHEIRKGIEATMGPKEHFFYIRLIRNRMKTIKPQKYIQFWKDFHSTSMCLGDENRTKQCFKEMPTKLKYLLYDGCKARRDNIVDADDISEMSDDEINDELEQINRELMEMR